MAEDWRGIDLDAELDSEDLTSQEFTNADAESDGGKKAKRKPSLRGGGLLAWIKNPLVWIITAVVVLALILVWWFFGRGGSTTTSTPDAGTSGSNIAQVSSQKEGLSKSTYQIFTNGIKYALKGNDVKNQVASDWRAATIKYGETNDLEAFKAELVKINDTRKQALEKIPNDEYALNQYMIETLNVQRDYLNKAYAATSSEEATNVYNDWRNNVNIDRDNEYITILIAELEKVDIPYEKTENDGNLSVTF